MVLLLKNYDEDIPLATFRCPLKKSELVFLSTPGDEELRELDSVSTIDFYYL